jgi:hypothetical protein
MSQIPNDAELTGIELALGGLIPAASGLDRDRLMFQAGAFSRSRSRRARWVWPPVAAVLALVVACESVFLARRPAERVVVVHVPAEALTAEPPRDRLDPSAAPAVIPSTDVESPGTAPESLAFLTGTTTSEHQRLQDLVLRFGLDAFPEPVRGFAPAGGLTDTPDSGSSTAGALRRIELEKLLKPGDHS